MKYAVTYEDVDYEERVQHIEASEIAIDDTGAMWFLDVVGAVVFVLPFSRLVVVERLS